MSKLTQASLRNTRVLCDEPGPWENWKVRALLNHIDAIEAEKNRLIDNVAQLQKELTTANTNTKLAIQNAQEWQDELLKVQRVEKVVLPKDVADALEATKPSEGMDIDYFIWTIVRYDLENGKCSNRKTLFDHANGSPNGVSDLVLALRTGYTVEEEPTTEEKIFSKLKELINEEQLDIEEHVVSRIAHHSVLAMREILGEDAVKHHESE